jgi:hypothetical protein
MDIQVFRSPRKKLINPRMKVYGGAMILTSILTVFMLYFLMDRISANSLWITLGIAAVLFVTGLVLIFLCLKSDPHNIHAFALTEAGDLYHITVGIPEFVVYKSNLSDMFGLGALSRDKTTSFADSADLACAPDFAQRVQEALIKGAEGRKMEWKEYNNIYSATATMVKMENPEVEAFSLGCAIIRYHLPTGTEPRRAGLFKHNEGYDDLMKHIQSLSKTGAASNK